MTITTTAAAVPDTAAQQPTTEGEHRLLTEAATAVALPFTLVEQLLPDNVVPVALGAGALAVAGVIEWPAAAAATLGYFALRRWRRPVTTRSTGRPTQA